MASLFGTVTNTKGCIVSVLSFVSSCQQTSIVVICFVVLHNSYKMIGYVFVGALVVY